MNLIKVRKKTLKKFKNKLLNEEDIFSYINSLCYELDVNDYLINIHFIDDTKNNILAFYSFKNKSISINLNKIIEFETKNFYKVDTLNEDDKIFFINLSIIVTIMHEMIHVYQNALIQNYENDLFNLFYHELEYGEKDYDNYLKYYYLLSIERESITTSYENILLFLRKYFKHDIDMFDYYIDNLDYVLRYGYNEVGEDNIFISPNETLFKEYFKLDNPEYTASDIYNNMKYGFKISKEDFDYYFDNTRDIIYKKIGLK